MKTANHSYGADAGPARLAHLAFVAQWRLAPAAHADRLSGSHRMPKSEREPWLGLTVGTDTHVQPLSKPAPHYH